MYCTKCGTELRDENDRFCSQCGNRMGIQEPTIVRPRLMLDKGNKKVAGVCAGFARYFDADVMLMRILWLGIALCTGVGFIVYLAAWIIVPSDEDVAYQARLQQY